jgi:hypothetical protein
MAENPNNDRATANSKDGLQQAVDGVLGGNYLGDPVVVDQLVRDFMAEVFSARAAWHESGDGNAAVGRINHLCKQYGAVILGEGTGHVAQAWNSPHRLGAMLRVLVPDAADFDSPGEAYFQFLATQALRAAVATEEGATEADVQRDLTAVVADAVDVILGRRSGGAE